MRLPEGACDTHVHVFRPDLYPYAPDRAYTPGRISSRDLKGFLDGHGFDRVVIVQPSVYGTDNRAMLDAVKVLGRKRARGIAVVDLDKVSDRQLADMAAAGVAGIRLNVNTRPEGKLSRLARLAQDRLSGSPWIVQVYAPLADIVGARRALMRLKQPLVLDHFGGARLRSPALKEGVPVLVDLARNGPAYLKVSGVYRVVPREGHDWARWPTAKGLFGKLMKAGGDKIIWGSDWPHTGGHTRTGQNQNAVEPFQPIDDKHAIRLLSDWLGDKAMFRQILVETPGKLYGFDAPAGVATRRLSRAR